MILNYVDGDSTGFSEAEFEDIRRCLGTLLSVAVGSQPMDRDFGIDYDGVVDYPIPVAKNMLALEIMEKVERYEPRVEITQIDFEVIEDSVIVPHIHFAKAEREDE